MNAVTPARSAGLRLSHAVVGVAAVYQLIGSEWMEPPWKFERASALEQQMFELHEWVGLAAGAALLIMLVSLWRRYGFTLAGHFMPWLAGGSRALFRTQLREAVSSTFRLRAPPATRVAVLAAAWEGLGLLSLAFLAATGALMALIEDSPQLMHDIGEVHELGVLPLKLYILGHAGMALLHELRGEGLIRRMWGGRQA